MKQKLQLCDSNVYSTKRKKIVTTDRFNVKLIDIPTTTHPFASFLLSMFVYTFSLYFVTNFSHAKCIIYGIEHVLFKDSSNHALGRDTLDYTIVVFFRGDSRSFISIQYFITLVFRGRM